MFGVITNNFLMFRDWLCFTIVAMQLAFLDSLFRPSFKRTKRMSDERFSQLIDVAHNR
jgi:hypothetical protein